MDARDNDRGKSYLEQALISTAASRMDCVNELLQKEVPSTYFSTVTSSNNEIPLNCVNAVCIENDSMKSNNDTNNGNCGLNVDRVIPPPPKNKKIVVLKRPNLPRGHNLSSMINLEEKQCDNGETNTLPQTFASSSQTANNAPTCQTTNASRHATQKSLEEREQEYNAARQRIFGTSASKSSAKADNYDYLTTTSVPSSYAYEIPDSYFNPVYQMPHYQTINMIHNGMQQVTPMYDANFPEPSWQQPDAIISVPYGSVYYSAPTVTRQLQPETLFNPLYKSATNTVQPAHNNDQLSSGNCDTSIPKIDED